MLSPETAMAFEDPNLDEAFDISQVSWIATANDERRIDPVLLDRMQVIHVRSPGRRHVEAHANWAFFRMLEREGISRDDEPPLSGFEIQLVKWQWDGKSFRTLDQMVENVWNTREEARR
jgi:ATP-dependent Lon protease